MDLFAFGAPGCYSPLKPAACLLTGWSLVRIRPGEPSTNSAFDFVWFFARIGKPIGQVCRRMFSFHLGDSCPRQLFAISGLRIALDLFKRRVAGNGWDLMHCPP